MNDLTPQSKNQVEETSSQVEKEQPGATTRLTIIVAQRGGGQYTKISEAIRDAQDNAHIQVRPGLYTEGLVIDRRLKISGEGRRSEIIIECSGTSCVRMETEYAEVHNFTIRCQAELAQEKYHAVDIPNGRLVLTDCDITSDSSACVAIHGSTTNPIIQNCTIHDGKEHGVLVYENAQGLLKDRVLENCDIFGNVLAGVKVKQGGKLRLQECKVHDNSGSGVLICEGGEGTVESCNMFGNTYAGVEIRQGAITEVRHCTIRDGNWVGVLICENSRVEVEGSEISGSAYVGVEIREQPGVDIQDASGVGTTLAAEVEIQEQSDVDIQEVSSTPRIKMGMVEIGIVLQRFMDAFYSLVRIVPRDTQRDTSKRAEK